MNDCKQIDYQTGFSPCFIAKVCLYHNCEHFNQANLNGFATQGEWKSIDSAPDETWIEVIGDSEMTHQIPFLAIAKKMLIYRPLNPWRDITYAALSDNGWTPLFWRNLSPMPNIRK